MTPAIEATTESAVHRDYVRVKSREGPFVRTAEHDATIRAIDAAYRAWAHARNLDAKPGEHRFTGRFWGRGITFFTGLSGTTPISAEIMIDALLPTEHCVLIQRDMATDQEKTQQRMFGLVLSVFASGPGRFIRSIGITPRGLRVRLEPLVPPADIDELLDVLVELVSSLACLRRSVGSSDSATMPTPP
jgi:hypothetical protein